MSVANYLHRPVFLLTVRKQPLILLREITISEASSVQYLLHFSCYKLHTDTNSKIKPRVIFRNVSEHGSQLSEDNKELAKDSKKK
jgi:hypothetical protein